MDAMKRPTALTIVTMSCPRARIGMNSIRSTHAMAFPTADKMGKMQPRQTAAMQLAIALQHGFRQWWYKHRHASRIVCHANRRTAAMPR
jgi:hypothetical protein